LHGEIGVILQIAADLGAVGDDRNLELP